MTKDIDYSKIFVKVTMFSPKLTMEGPRGQEGRSMNVSAEIDYRAEDTVSLSDAIWAYLYLAGEKSDIQMAVDALLQDGQYFINTRNSLYFFVVVGAKDYNPDIDVNGLK